MSPDIASAALGYIPLDHYSRFIHLTYVTLRFIRNCRNQQSSSTPVDRSDTQGQGLLVSNIAGTAFQMHVLKSVLNLPIFSLHLFVGILSVGGRLNSTQFHFQLDALLFYTQSLSSSSNLNTLTYYTPDVSTSLCCRYYVFSSGKSIRSVMPCLPMKSWVSV